MKHLIWIPGIALVFFLSWFFGRQLQLQDKITFQPMATMLCQPVGKTCNAEFSDVTLQLTFVSPVVVMSPFVASVATQADISEMYLVFRMRDMDMGVQRYRMQKNNDGVWQSAITLPVCALGRSDWTAILQVSYKKTWWRGEFDFTASGAL